jgi:hypothetical protein
LQTPKPDFFKDPIKEEPRQKLIYMTSAGVLKTCSDNRTKGALKKEISTPSYIKFISFSAVKGM